MMILSVPETSEYKKTKGFILYKKKRKYILN